MLEVNRAAIYAAARQQKQQGVDSPFVVSVATFGRGIRQEVLQALQPTVGPLGTINRWWRCRLPRW